MDNPREKRLEEWIHRELARLPDREAPADLVGRVLAAIQADARKPWWRKAWSDWPSMMQACSLPVMAGCAGLVAWFASVLWQSALAATLSSAVAGVASQALSIIELFAALLGVASRVALSSDPRWLLASVAVASIMYLTCITVGTICFRVALPKRSNAP